MRPAPFTYAAPQTLDEALALLADSAQEPKPLAGGQSLIAMMNFRLARPRMLVDLRRIPELSGIHDDGGSLRLGGMTTHTAVAASPLIDDAMPVMVNAVRRIGHRAIRNRGTIGGSLAHADPAAEWALVALGLQAEVACVSARGARTVDAGDFFRGHFATALEPDELITTVTFPALDVRSGWSFQEFSRQAGAFGLALVIASARTAEDGTVAGLRVCLGGCGDVPVELDTEGVELIGAALEDRVVRHAAGQLLAGLSARSDVHATGEDRLTIAHELVVRALTEATRAGQAHREGVERVM
jgi:carbon-monoxide dehydrogenase medium subunit